VQQGDPEGCAPTVALGLCVMLHPIGDPFASSLAVEERMEIVWLAG
jgi:hypothetical protein